MKSLTRVITKCTLVMAATASLGSVTALAVENTMPFQNPPAFVENAGIGKVDWKSGEEWKFIGRERGEITEEEKAARMENFKATLAEKLAAGEITQEKYDEVIANMESGNFTPNKQGLNGMVGERIKNFKMPEGGKIVQPENFKTKLAEKLAAGEITQEKYDEVIANMESGNFKPIKWENVDVKHPMPFKTDRPDLP